MVEPYRHEALPYSGHEQFLSACCTLTDESRARDQRLIFLVAAAKLADLRDVLGGSADDVTFVSTDEHARNPARVTTLFDSFQAGADGRRCCGVNEPIDPARTPAELQEAQLTESLLNAPPLGSWPMGIVCLYDTSRLDGDSLGHMRRAHPRIRGQPANPAYTPQLGEQLFSSPLDDPPDQAERLDVASGELSVAREFVREFAEASKLAPDRREDLVLAANEVVTNSMRHGGGACRLAVWDADGVVCEVRDAGVITDPMVGRLTPSLNATAGRGLWLVNHLCDLVQLRSSHGGTVVRLHVRR